MMPRLTRPSKQQAPARADEVPGLAGLDRANEA